MGKRILSLLLAFVMVVGMIPASAFDVFAAAEQSATPTGNIFAAKAQNVTVNGSLDETSWLTYGKMVSEGTEETISFGVLWDRDNLYFGIRDTGDVTVSVNGKTAEATVSKAADAQEIAVDLASVDAFAGEVLDVVLSCDGYTWNGTVTLDLADRAYAHNFVAPAAGGTGGALGGIANGNSVTMYNRYNAATATGEEGSKQNTNEGARVHSVSTNLAVLQDDSKTYVVEFDFDATKLPAYYENPSYVGEYYGAYGMCLGFDTLTRTNGFSIGIGNSKNNGLYIMYTSAYADHQWFELGKEEGDVFHVRLEYKPSGKLLIYADDVKVGEVAKAKCAGWGSSTAKQMINMNLYGGAVLHPTEDGKNDMEFTVSNFFVSSFCDDEIVASVAYTGSSGTFTPAEAPTFDGETGDHIWTRAYALNAEDASVKGSVAASWLKNKLYFALDYTGATEAVLKLGTKTWQLSLAQESGTTSDGAVAWKNSGNTAELEVDLIKAGIAVASYNTKVPFGMLLSDGTHTAALEGDRSLVFSALNNMYVYSYSDNSGEATPIVNQKYNCVYSLKGDSARYRLGTQDTNKRPEINRADDLYLEQKVTVNHLDSSNGTFDGGSFDKPLGYAYQITDADGNTSIGLLYNKNGELYLAIYTRPAGSVTYLHIPLGIAVNDENPPTFVLGHLWKTDGSVDIYVDGVKKASAKGSYNPSSLQKQSFRFLTYGVNADVTFTDVYCVSGYNYTSPTVTTEKILIQGNVDKSNVGETLVGTYEEGHFKFGVTWKCSNPDIIAADGTVTQPKGEAATVKVAAVVGGTALGEVEVTVPAAAPELVMAEGTYDAFVAENITLDGSLSETAWRTGSKLGKGQPFDILWDGHNLYFGVVAAEGDETMTVKIGDTVVVDAAALGSGNAFEAKVAYTTKGVTAIEDVTIIVGESAWKGTVNLVTFARQDRLELSGVTTAFGNKMEGSAVTATEDGRGMVFNIPARETPISNVTSAIAIQNPASVITNRAEDIVLEFVFDPANMPKTTNIGSISSKKYMHYGGFEFGLFDGNGESIVCGIHNYNGTLYMNFMVPNGVTEVNRVTLGSAGMDPFAVKLIWQTDDTLLAYVDGELVKTVANATSGDTVMAGDKHANKAILKAWRYDYNLDHGCNELFNVTVSDISLGKTVEVDYTEILEGNTFDAFVGTGLTMDGDAKETAWRFAEKLSGGQRFDILWNGDNLYFAVEALEGDSQLTVKLGEETIGTAVLAEGAKAFELKVAKDNFGISILEDVTLSVGESTWTGNVKLTKMARTYTLDFAGSNCSRGYEYFDKSTDYTNLNLSKTTDSATFSNVYKEGAPNLANGRIYTLHIGNGFNLAENRTDDRIIEFDFIAEHLPAYPNSTHIGAVYAAYGLSGTMSDSQKDGIQWGIKKADDNKLYFVIVGQTTDSDKEDGCQKPVKYIALDKAEDELFSVRMVWTAENSVSVYVDGELKGTADNMLHKGCIGTSTFGFQLWGPGSAMTADGANDNVFTVSNVRIAAPTEVSYSSEKLMDAFVAEDIVIDGQLNETSWRPLQTLSNGQPFDVLYDGNNLYFAVVAKEGDTELTVKLDNVTLTTATLADGAKAFEVKVPYAAKDVSALEALTLTVGESTWTGKANLVKLARREVLTVDNATTGVAQKTTGSVTATGTNGIVFEMEANSEVTGVVGDAHAMRSGLELLTYRTADTAIEFNFDPASMPVNSNLGAIGRSYAVYSGLELIMADEEGYAIVCGIGNSEDGLYFNTAYGGGVCGHIVLDRTVDDGAFDVKIVWRIDSSVDLYIDGVKKGNVANTTNTDDIMAQSAHTMNNMVHIRASRYDYNDMLLNQAVKFTVSDVKISCDANAVSMSTGNHDAFVAQNITVDGSLTETSWRTSSKLGAGQPFDILWDGDNLYVAVIPNEGDTDLTVKLGKQVLGTATLAEGASAFELKIPYDNFAVTALEGITLQVGTSFWTGDVTLSQFVRVANPDNTVLTKLSGAPTKYEDGFAFALPNNGGATDIRHIAYAENMSILDERNDNLRLEFDFDPTGLGVIPASTTMQSAYYTPDAGFGTTILDVDKEGVLFGVQNVEGKGLVFLTKTRTKIDGVVGADRNVYELNRTVSDGPFHICVEWTIDGSLVLYINGKYETTFEHVQFNNYTVKSEKGNRIIMFEAWRSAALKDVSVGFKVSNIAFSNTADVTYSNIPTMDALLTQETMVVDGNLTEVAWLDWYRFTEPAGNLAAAWSKGNLFLAVHSAEGEKLELNINNVAASLDLTTGVITGYTGAEVAKNAKTGVYEIRIPLTAIGFNPTDYNQSVPFTAKLVKGNKSAMVKAGNLNFSGSIAEVQSLGNYTKNSGPFTLLGNEATYIGKEAGALHYMYKINNNHDHNNNLIVLSNDLQFNKLPITDGQQTSSSEANGFFYYFGDQEDQKSGLTVFTVIFTEDGTNLKMRIGQGGGKEGTVFDLNKTLGEKFRVTQYWYPDDTLEIYVDGVLLGVVKNASYATSSMGVDVITYRYKSSKASNNNVNILIGNQTKIVKKYNKVTDELTPNVVFGRTDLEHVQKNLNMVTSYTSANFEALPLRWTTTDASVVEINGTIHRHETEPKSATVAVYYGDSSTPLWSVEITVDPMNVAYNAAPAVIHTAFAKADSITLDGSLEGETWLLNGWVLSDDDQLVGYFGTQWNQQHLYIALDVLEAKTVSLKLGEMTVAVDMAAKTITGVEGEIAVSGSVAEIKIPVSELFGQAKLETTDATLDITVTMDGHAYTGKLAMSNVDWWATDNLHSGLPMLANNVKSVKEVGADYPDGNQGAKQLENGYRFYDLYNPNGTNPTKIRTYVLFMKQPIYEGFADRTDATYIEFDFDAKALPAWEWDEGVKDSLSRAFSNYGVTFSLSDKADSAKNSNVAVFGIVNTADGLTFVGRRGSEDYVAYPMGKSVGEVFRLSLSWELDGTLIVYIDGEHFQTIPGMSVFDNSVGDTSFVVNMIRNGKKPTSEADNMEVYITNIAFGKAFSSDNVIKNLTFDTIKGENETIDDIFADLNLPRYITNGQMDHQYLITWTSSDSEVVDPETGEVTRPETGIKRVLLTATLDNNGTTETKEFNLFIAGLEVSTGNALVCTEDVDPFSKAGYEYLSQAYYLDKTNNSIIYAFGEDETPTAINLVTLTDLDEVARLNRESLRLFISGDNETYTEIEDYKLHHDGYNWYLYDFEATARYIKVHYTHRDSDDVSFVNTPADMIHVSWDSSLDIPANAAEIAVPAATLLDQAVAIELPAGVTTKNLRVALGSELLFHYVDRDGTVYVRIPNKDTGVLKLWNADGIELADKENVYEVTYGTRETLPASARWILSVKAGTVFPDGSVCPVDTLYSMKGAIVEASTDGGYTWSSVGKININASLNTGGWGFDSKTHRMLHESHIVDSWDESDITKSVCTTVVHYSDDGGKTWTKAEGLGVFDRNEFYTNYVLSYTDMTELAGNDGTGPNVDFVFPMGAQYNNNGAFCGLVAYTRDGGLTWDYSDSVITFGNELAFEGGVSEATILEREDGTLVYYARCQSTGVDNFTISYSLDHGVTWLTPGATSTVYTTNTQALMMTYDFGGFDGNRLTGTPMFMWGGNNVMGGDSYKRVPLNFAISTNEMDTFRNIQNIFFETFMDVYDFEADHYITNASIQQVNDHDMYVAFSRLRVKDSIYMVVNDFTDWFVRTKGAYDSFEHGTGVYEGWVAQRGISDVTKDKASEGVYSLAIQNGAIVTRSVPYLQNGSVALDLYVDSNSKFTFELQPAFANSVNKCAVVSAQVVGTTMTFQDGTVLTLRDGWNKVVFELELTDYKASVQVNGGKDYALQINTVFDNGSGMQASHELGNYVTYLTILNEGSVVYVDEVLVESTLDAVLDATDADKAAADAVIEKIKAIETKTGDEKTEAIAAARKAYDKLAQVQKDLVNRRIRDTAADEEVAITTGKIEDYMTNYYDVLVAAENAVVESAGDPEIAMINATLNDYIRVGVWTILPDAYSNATMQFSYNGKTVSASACEERTYEGVKYTVFYLDLAAKEMADAITVTLKHNGAVVDEETTTIRDYLDYVNGSESASTETKALVQAMASYGAAAQVYFDHNTDNPADENTKYEVPFNKDAAMEVLNNHVAERGKTDGNVTLWGLNLVLEERTVLRFIFNVDDSVAGSFKVTDKNGAVLDTEKRNGKYYVHVYGIAAKDLDEMVELTVTDGTSTWTVAASPLTYCRIILNGNYSENLVNVVKALYNYNQTANAYFD